MFCPFRPFLASFLLCLWEMCLWQLFKLIRPRFLQNIGPFFQIGLDLPVKCKVESSSSINLESTTEVNSVVFVVLGSIRSIGQYSRNGCFFKLSRPVFYKTNLVFKSRQLFKLIRPRFSKHWPVFSNRTGLACEVQSRKLKFDKSRVYHRGKP